jgi:hypothetical protein
MAVAGEVLLMTLAPSETAVVKLYFLLFQKSLDDIKMEVM